MVSSLDGAVAVDGSSGGLGNPHDIEVLVALRRLADVVVVGAGTARGEGYGPPKRPGLRIGVVTNSGRVDTSTPLFRSGSGFLIAPEQAAVPHGVDVLRAGAATVDLATAMATIDRIVPGATYVHAEGGPTLNGALLAADLVDELDLTWSPRLVGGASPRLTEGAEQHLARFEPAHLLLDGDGYVFGRWVRARSNDGPVQPAG